MDRTIDLPSHNTADVAALVAAQLATPSTGWAIGAFGAIGEFMRGADEAVALDARGAVTPRGAIRIDLPAAATRVIAYETLQGEDAWSGAVALCVTADSAAVPRHAALTELGPDRDALRAADRDAVLFDMGLALGNVQACVRSADPRTIALLRRFCGQPILTHGAAELFMQLPALSPHRVFLSTLGRVEVYQSIPTHDGKTPEGPHTHVLPKLLRAQRTHAADIPIPEGWLPAVTLYPESPVRDALGRRRPFDAGAFTAWQALFERYRLHHAPDSRFGRIAMRVAERKQRVLQGAATA